MCEIEEPGRKTSSASSPKASIALAIIQRSVSCVWVTPLAGPVLPEVKKIAAGSVGSGAARSAAGSASSSRAKRCAAQSPAPASSSGESP